MLDAFGADEGFCELSDKGSLAAKDEDFETVVVVEMDVEGREDSVEGLVLNFG